MGLGLWEYKRDPNTKALNRRGLKNQGSTSIGFLKGRSRLRPQEPHGIKSYISLDNSCSLRFRVYGLGFRGLGFRA